MRSKQTRAAMSLLELFAHARMDLDGWMNEWMNEWMDCSGENAGERKTRLLSQRSVTSRVAILETSHLAAGVFSFLFEFIERFLSAGRSAVPSLARIATDGFQRDHFQV